MAWGAGLGASMVLLAASSTIAARNDPKAATASPSPNGPTIRLTVEIDWSAPPSPFAPTVVLSLSEGKVLATTTGLEATGDSHCRLGTSLKGRVRARLEAPLGATLTVQAGSQATTIPLSRLLDGPQRTVPPAAIDVGFARVAWDAIEVDAGPSDGTTAPGAKLPIRVGLNVLSTDAAEVNLTAGTPS